MQKFLIVDDDTVFRKRLGRAFRDRGFEVAEAEDFNSAIKTLENFAPEMAVIDLRMPGKSGLELLRELKIRLSGLKVLVLTGYGSIVTALEAVRLGAVHYLTKPATADQILQAFEPGNAVPVKYKAAPVPSLSQVEWEHIQRVMQECSGNVSKASKILGIHRRSLQRKLSKDPGNLK